MQPHCRCHNVIEPNAQNATFSQVFFEEKKLIRND